MSTPSVHIDALVLSIPGLDRDAAREVGDRLTRRLADALLATPATVDLGRLDLRLTLPPDLSIDALVDRLTSAILSRLR